MLPSPHAQLIIVITVPCVPGVAEPVMVTVSPLICGVFRFRVGLIGIGPVVVVVVVVVCVKTAEIVTLLLGIVNEHGLLSGPLVQSTPVVIQIENVHPWAADA